MRSDGNIFTL